MTDRPVALVTGAAQGLGSAIAKRLADEGFAVAVNDVKWERRLTSLARAIAGLAVPGDISAPTAAHDIVEEVVSKLGFIHVLVANAAAMHMEPFAHANRAAWWHQIDVNLSGHFRLIQAVVPGMRQHGAGRIILISSGWGVVGHPNATAYAASKAGLIALCKGLGRELGRDGILTNAVAPAYIDTTQLQVDADDLGITLDAMRRRYAEQLPTRNLQTTSEIAGTVAFLAGPDSGGVVGQILQPNGGLTRTRA